MVNCLIWKLGLVALMVTLTSAQMNLFSSASKFIQDQTEFEDGKSFVNSKSMSREKRPGNLLAYLSLSRGKIL